MNKLQIDILKRELDEKLINSIDSWSEKEGLAEYPLIDVLFEIIDLYFSIKDENETSE